MLLDQLCTVLGLCCCREEPLVSNMQLTLSEAGTVGYFDFVFKVTVAATM